MDKTERQVALDVLNLFEPKAANAAEILDKYIGQTQRRRRATGIVFGVIRNRAALDTIISHAAGVPKARIKKKLLNILRIGAYEIIFLDSAEYAVVNEAVNLAQSAASKRACGFVNAVLRNITRSIENKSISPSEADPTRTLPKNRESGCMFDFAFLPDPDKAGGEYLSGAFSLPQWLVEQWLKDYGFAKSRDICFASNRNPSIYVRPNTLKTSIEELSEKFASGSVEFEIVESAAMIKLTSPGPIRKLPGFEDGLFTVQDITASEAVKILKPEKKETILDFCAAPGTKTTQMAELMCDSGTIVATDIDAFRLKKVDENCRRLGISSVETIPYEKVDQLGLYDAILLDVPCSNTAVLAKRCEVRLRINKKHLNRLATTQMQLLERALQLLKPGGRLCYSTCSILKQENEMPIAKFLSKESDWALRCDKLTLPSAERVDCDGGYVAILSKVAKS